MAVHSPGSNCSKDSCDESLDNLRGFLTGETLAGIQALHDTTNINLSIPRELLIKRQTKIAANIVVYISGFIVRRLLKKKPKL